MFLISDQIIDQTTLNRSKQPEYESLRVACVRWIDLLNVKKKNFILIRSAQKVKKNQENINEICFCDEKPLLQIYIFDH